MSQPENTYEMLWDCKFCGTTKNLGKTHRFCPNCGAAQDPAWRYFPSDDEKVAVEEHVFVGVDVTCPACGTLNSAAANNCMQCGAALTGGQQAKTLGTQQKALDAKFEREDLQARLRQERDAQVGRAQPQSAKKEAAGRLNWLPILLGVLALLICGGVLFLVFYTRSSDVYVTGHHWEREIQIEQYTARSDSAWCDSMPGDAYSITRTREQRGSEQVPDGQDCRVQRVDNGDGTFSERQVCETRYRSEPVYDDRCYFTVDRWVYVRSVTADGDSVDDRLVWPNTGIGSSCSRLGCEREGNRREEYVLQLRGSGDARYECSVALDLWQRTRIEDTFRLQVNLLGQPRCDSLQRAG
ncbi:MAG: zinc ribbon domain-containing protein [Chloroflexi bacterium]|nr:zinc ribbon domain-containing protein [Chloroflexota bacterium]